MATVTFLLLLNFEKIYYARDKLYRVIYCI